MKQTQTPRQPLKPPIQQVSKKERTWWFDARALSGGDGRVVEAAKKAGCGGVLVGLKQKDKLAAGLPRIVQIDKAEQIESLAKDDQVLTSDVEILEAARKSGRKAGLFIEVKDLQAEFPYCEAMVQRGYDFVVIDMYHATYIPFELLVAHIKDTPTKIFRVVPVKQLEGTIDDVTQSMLAFMTLELGVSVMLSSPRAEDIERLSKQVELSQPGQLELLEAEVVKVQHTGMGDRVCIDTTTLMTPEEGMILGSTGQGGIFVCSETHELPHMNFREFRVNAGAVHCYVWGPNNRVIYLSECRAGTPLLAVDVHGRTRVVTVGRAKIERRPLVLISCRANWNGKPIEINTFVQDDWHVRVMGADFKVRNSALMKVGDKLLAHPDIPGRHTGLSVPIETVEI